MADGDDAAEVGMPILTGIAKVWEFFKHINKTRDLIANHITGSLGQHTIEQITGFDADAIITALGFTPVEQGGGSGMGSNKIYIGWAGGQLLLQVDATPLGGIRLISDGNFDAAGLRSTATYAQSVAGMGGFRTVSVAANGVLGGLTSSRRFKRDIEHAEIPRETLRALRVVWFRYRADVMVGDEAQQQLGLIAEEVHDLGLGWLVDYEDGKPYALNDRFLPFLALLLAQDDANRIDDLERELAELKGAKDA